jgi:DNA-binding transcriptional regulator YiaG
MINAIIRQGCQRGQVWGERLVRQRLTLELSQKSAAAQLSVDPSTLALWERGEGEPVGAALGRVEKLPARGDAEARRLAG